jgi:hypothetical protein
VFSGSKEKAALGSLKWVKEKYIGKGKKFLKKQAKNLYFIFDQKNFENQHSIYRKDVS